MRKYLLIMGLLVSVTAYAAENEVKEYGIAILLDDNCTKQAVMLHKQLAADLPDLGDVKNTWHVSLYQAAFMPEDLEVIYKKLQKLPLEPMVLKFGSIYDSTTRIGIEIAKNSDLQRLHAKVVQLVAPYHKRPLRSFSDNYNDLTVEQRQQVYDFGISGVLHTYFPHVTLFYQDPANSKLQIAAKEISAPVGMKCSTMKLVIGEIGYSGNLKKIIYTVPFNHQK